MDGVGKRSVITFSREVQAEMGAHEIDFSNVYSSLAEVNERTALLANVQWKDRPLADCTIYDQSLAFYGT